MRQQGWLFIFIACIGMAACDGAVNYAPVTEVASIQPVPKSGVHTVVHGETLYEIAWRYGLDYRYLARRNQLTSPYILHTGQVIFLRGKAAHTVTVVSTVQKSPIQNTSIKFESKWQWPVKGRVVNAYSANNKGIDIAGTVGAPIYAAASGDVVYAGDGLKGYGNLIILKHNAEYMSAYAYNKRILVKEGQQVKQGQKIAEMGIAGSDRAMLHFEIRKAGQPVNPLSLL